VVSRDRTALPVASAGPGPSTGRWTYLDNLKVLLIAVIIAMHAVLSYSTVEVWTYTAMREVTLNPVVEAVLFVGVIPFGLFLIALLFLVAGLLTPPSVQRKGPGGFARDRLLRLGVPFAVYVLILQPTIVYLLEHPLGAAPGSYWQEFLGDEGALDTGPLWFVGVLLVYSLAYAGWVHLRADRPPRQGGGGVTAGRLLLVAAVVAPASFLIRLIYPYGGEAGFTDLNLWQWPACIAVFALGISGSRQGWLSAVPGRLHRQCRTATLLAVVAMAVLLVLVGLGGDIEDMVGGYTWAALGFAVIESVLNLFGSVWLLGLAQHHLHREHQWGPELNRSAYGAFILQTAVLIGLAVALRPLALPAEAKALLLATGAVAGSFGLSSLLVRRIPAAARIL
jgi:hypothetical protein